MKAFFCERYGPPEVLQLKEAEKPAPTEGRILVKIKAASVNPVDWHGMRGSPFLIRFGGGLRRPKDARFGTDFAGVVEAVGSGATAFKPGDEVFGVCPGALAEYGSAREDRVALKPSNVSFEEAAAVPVAGITALQALRDRGRIQAGRQVLINGASGGVGTFAVQIAKSFGTEVTAVCSPRNLERAGAIGANHVVDYTKDDFTKSGLRYDLICDVACTRSAFAYGRALKPGGVCVIVGVVNTARLPLNLALGPAASRGGKKVGFMGIAKVTSKDLSFLGELLGAKKIAPVVDRRYAFSDTAEAVGYLEEGHAQGKVVIAVS